MKRISKKKLLNSDCVFVVFAIVVLLLSILPLLYIGKYNVMSADDYAIGKDINKIWSNTHNMVNMVKYSAYYVGSMYQSLRGCFTISFFDCWNPGFFGEEFTWITPIIMISTILLCMYFLVKICVDAFFSDSTKEINIVWAVLCFLIIQTMPSPAEGFYWYAGAISYTFLHYTMLILFVLFVKIQTSEDKKKKWAYTPIACIWAIGIGGSQWITVLVCLLMYTLLLMVNYKRLKSSIILPYAFLGVGFALSIFAPGNSVRQSSANGMGAIEAILYSFKNAVIYGKEWISPMFIATLVFLVPFIWQIVGKERKKYEYKCPMLISVISFCVFSAAFTAPLYGVGNVDSGRIHNSIQSIFYILCVVNIIYYIGWIKYKIDSSDREIYQDIKMIIGIIGKYRWHCKWTAFAIILLVFIGTGDKNTFSSISALRSLANGEAKAYYQEAQERISILNDSNYTIVEFEPHTVKPRVLFYNDIQADDSPDYWINLNMAEYYAKEEILLKEK